jgi:hypothetical protein
VHDVQPYVAYGGESGRSYTSLDKKKEKRKKRKKKKETSVVNRHASPQSFS